MLGEIRNNYSAIKKYAEMHRNEGFAAGVVGGIVLTIGGTTAKNVIESKFEVSDLANYAWAGIAFSTAYALYIAARSNWRKDPELDNIKKDMKIVALENQKEGLENKLKEAQHIS